MKVCQVCKEKAVTVRLTEIVDGKKAEHFLCEDCAQNRGINIAKKEEVFDEIDLSPSPLAELVAATKEEVPADTSATCPDCGLTYEEFRTNSTLGCPQDYEVFKKMLDPILEKIHGATQHTGKVPLNSGEKLSKEREIYQLKEKLKRTVSREEYEKAAQIRDQIIALEEGESDGSE